ncbi:MAG: DUF6473 family protein [Cypionkella sp.]
MAFLFPGAGALDYFPCHYGSSRIIFRGPKQNVEKAYVAVLGSTETYGKFVPHPYASLLGRSLGMPVVNLGCMNAGPDLYLQGPDLLQIAGQACATVVQIVGAHNISNRYYTVHPRRNDRFVAATPLLRAIFPKVDFTEFNFTRHMLMALQSTSADRFEVVAEELRAAWVARMQSLLGALQNRTVLLWMAEAPPPPPERRVDLARNPLLIDNEMIAAVRGRAASYLEAVYSDAAMARGCEGMAFAPMEAPAAAEVPGPLAHAEVAQALLPQVHRLISGRA